MSVFVQLGSGHHFHVRKCMVSTLVPAQQGTHFSSNFSPQVHAPWQFWALLNNSDRQTDKHWKLIGVYWTTWKANYSIYLKLFFLYRQSERQTNKQTHRQRNREFTRDSLNLSILFLMVHLSSVRSWTSSTITWLTPGRLDSPSRRRSRIPVVQ